MSLGKSIDEAYDDALAGLAAARKELGHVARSFTQKADGLVHAGTVQGLAGALYGIEKAVRDVRRSPFSDVEAITKSAEQLANAPKADDGTARD